MSRNNLNNIILVNKAVGELKRKFNMSSTSGLTKIVTGNVVEIVTLNDIFE